VLFILDNSASIDDELMEEMERFLKGYVEGLVNENKRNLQEEPEMTEEEAKAV